VLERIITGGQTGADQGALRAARAAGLATGGYAPAGWVTEEGPAPSLAFYGLVELPGADDATRRRRNVEAGDAALLFGDRTSPRAQGFVTDCERHGRPLVWIQPGVSRPSHIVRWLRETPHVKVLMVAGNRESRAPEIGDRVAWFLGVVFRELGHRPRV
jgi:hypothetical protein